MDQNSKNNELSCPTQSTDNETSDLQAINNMQEEIANATLAHGISVENLVQKLRPNIQELILGSRNNPTKAMSPSSYYDSLRVAEETLRQGILRGLGYLAVIPLVERTLINLHGNNLGWQRRYNHFTSEVGRGREHTDARGEFVRRSDRILRTLAESVFYFLSVDEQIELHRVFEDVSRNTRTLAAQTLDSKFGDEWYQFDPKNVANLKIKEIDNKKLSRHDRHVLIKTQKPLNVRYSFSNAVATASEFTAIGIEDLHYALARKQCPSEYWYPYCFANLNKLSFAASLPFWAAQDLSEAGNYNDNMIFEATRHSLLSKSNFFSISFLNDAYQKYYNRSISGNCQGIYPFNIGRISQNSIEVLNRLNSSIDAITMIDDEKLPIDTPFHNSSKSSSANAATALVISLAYREKYDFLSDVRAQHGIFKQSRAAF